MFSMRHTSGVMVVQDFSAQQPEFKPDFAAYKFR
jgi:hypothetical protein